MVESIPGFTQQTSPYLPSSAGIYILHLHLDNQHDLQIGRLRKFSFPPGEYLYVGSARGPGGIAARLGRHLRGKWSLPLTYRLVEKGGWSQWIFLPGDKRKPGMCLEPTAGCPA